MTNTSCRGEGCDPAMGITEVPMPWISQQLQWAQGTKQHGELPMMCARTQHGHVRTRKKPSTVVKRSLNRAYKRAQQIGYAWYRGQLCSALDFERMGCSGHHSPPPTLPSDALFKEWQQCNRKHVNKSRLNIWQWNSGGLASNTLDEVKAWLSMNCVDIGIIVETRLTFDSQWSDADWNIVHSGEGTHKGKGIMILISRRLGNLTNMRWQFHESGRLVHARLQMNPRPIDIVACYQHTFNATKACLQARDKWWTKLDQVLGGIPNRNCLILVGDFNSSLPFSHGITGSSSFTWNGQDCRGTTHPDQAQFLNILRGHALVTLNTWTPSLGPTYVHHEQASRIDYICVRQMFADHAARDVRYLWHSPFINQTQVGHVPILSNIARYWIPQNSSKHIQRITMQQRQVSRQAYLDSTPCWESLAQATHKHMLHFLGTPTTEVNTVTDGLHNAVFATFCEHFPPGSVPRSVQTWRPALCTILNKWEHRRRMLRPGLISLPNLFRVWHHAARFAHLKRVHRKEAKQIRNAQFNEVVVTATAAAEQHNTHKLFHLINRFAPKQPRKQIQIRNQQGMLATPIESAAIINKFVGDTWAGPCSMQLTFDQPPGVPFTIQQLEKALSLIPVTKAVAKPFAPGVIWRHSASVLAPLLHQQLQLWWSTSPPLIPDCWRHGWLFLIPKPNRPPSIPENLRPLALQEPVGKAVIGLLIHLAMKDVNAHIVRFPVWSYLEHRSTQEAIRCVSSHCSQVRQMVQHGRSTPLSRAAQVPRKGFYGGVQVCLDLKRAFDLVNRRKLFSRLHELQIRSSIIQLLTVWHEHTVYYTQSEDQDTPVATGRGVRQGCKAAPGLWTLFTLLFLHDLLDHVTIEWIQSHVTIYADDFHIGCIFESLAELSQFQQVLGIMFSTLASLDMIINPSKSVAIVAMRGSQCKAVRHHFIWRDRNGEKLKIPVPGHGEMHIPIHKHTKYLGVIISYSNFEDCSLRHRLTLMHAGFRRLQRWLTGKHCFSTAQRVKLWQTCIYPIFSYGLMATGMTLTGIKKAVTQMTIMLRKIIHDHSYMTHRTNEIALLRLKIPPPLSLLHGTAAGLLRTLESRQAQLFSHDLAHLIDWTHLPTLMDQLTQMQATTSFETPALQLEANWQLPFFQCAHCDFCTDDVSVFRRHCTIAHDAKMFRTHFVNPANFAVDGLPICKFCHQTFTTWRSFLTHIERGCQELVSGPQTCTIGADRVGAALGTIDLPAQHMADVAARGLRLITAEELHTLRTLPFGDKLLQIVQTRDWEKVPQMPDACRFLASHCMMCSFQFSRCQELHQHYRLHHPELWEHAPQKAIQLTNLFCEDSPCHCCGALFQQHSCPTWSQLAVLLVNGAGVDINDDTPLTQERLRCELCLETFPTPAELVQHLQANHGLQGLSFNASRDALDNSTACAHCGQLFMTMGGLKSHVVQGRCQYFNPQATAETKAVEGLWTEACLDGKLLEVLRSPPNRMRLTVVCQACGKGCQRAADLALHLQTAHSRLWRLSRRLTLVLVAAFAKNQCFCNPTLGVKRGNHICLPLRQIAMCFHRLNREPFAPTLVTDTTLKAIFSEHLPRAAQYKLEQKLVHRQFADLWQDPDLLQLMRSQCLFCGARPLPADLALHLREEHPCGHEMFLFYMEQLLPVVHAINPDDYQCHLCRLIFNLPAHMRPDEPLHERVVLAQSHLRGSCPVLIQVALLLGSILNGNRLQHGLLSGGHRPEHLGADDEHFWPASATAGQDSESGPKPSQGEGTQTRRAKYPRSRRGQSGQNTQQGTSDDHHHGASLDTPRSRNVQSSQNRSIHSFFESRSDRSVASFDPGVHTVETGDGNQATNAPTAIAPAPCPGTDQIAARECREDSGEQGHGTIVPDIGANGSDPGRPELPLPSMGSESAEAGHRQEAANQCPEDVSTPDGTPGDAAGQRDCGPFSCLERSHGNIHQGSSMAPTDQPEKRQGLRPTFSAVSLLGLDGSGSHNETTFPESIADGLDPSDVAGHLQGQGPWQRPLQGQDFSETGGMRLLCIGRDDTDMIPTLVSCLYRLILSNEGNWCYLNSCTYGLLWTLLNLDAKPSNAWGPHHATLTDFLQQHAGTPAKLAELPWVRGILCDWGPSQGQRDCAECTHRLLTWLSSGSFDMRWERRLEKADGLVVLDTNTALTPITLTITPHMHMTGHCTFTDLISTWMQELSMKTALLQAPPCLCLAIDRYFQAEAGTIERSLCSIEMVTEVNMPVFISTDLRYDFSGYIPVASVAHLGADLAGHCRALLKLMPSMVTECQPAAWLTTDDDTEPQPIWNVPPWFAKHMTVVWLVRTDCLRQHASLPMIAHSEHSDGTPAPVTAPSVAAEMRSEVSNEAPMQELLTLLQAQTGATDMT